jgi:hypothetical protein
VTMLMFLRLLQMRTRLPGPGCRTPWQILSTRERMSEAEHRYEPKEPGRLGSKKDDHGLLPLELPIVEKLSDPGHFVKSYKSEQYVFVSAPKKTSLTCKADAMRLSRNMSYMLKQYRRGTENCSFEKFQRAAKASFKHHWNNHQFCGTWCQAKDWTDEEKETNKNMFRNKETHQKSTTNSLGCTANILRRIV